MGFPASPGDQPSPSRYRSTAWAGRYHNRYGGHSGWTD
jgi:hypothetical protein